jgi:hypothetical protein
MINQNPEEKSMKIDAMRQHYQTMLGDIPEEELQAKIDEELGNYQTIGSEYLYRTNTSDEDGKYSTLLNRKFQGLSKK